MNKIKVESLSVEEIDHGVTELWADGNLLAYTIYDEGDLMLRFEPNLNGSPVVIDVRGLTAALAEVNEVLGAH